MWPYLLASSQRERLKRISIYSEPGMSLEQMLFLYMNEDALAVWGEMGRCITVLGRLYLPPLGARLCFGTPFSAPT